MGVEVESFIWQPSSILYVVIFCSCFLSIFFLPHFSRNSSSNDPDPFDHGLSSSLISVQQRFIFLYSLASMMVGFWSVFGEFEFVSYGVSRESMVVYLCIGCLIVISFGTFIGILGDLFDHKKLFVIFWTLHLCIAICKKITLQSSILVGSIGLSLADSIFFVSYETWMVIQNEKLGYRQDTVNDVFWLMTFSESASFIGSQMLANWLIDSNLKGLVLSPPTAAIFLAIVGIIFTAKGWTNTKSFGTTMLRDYMIFFSVHIFGDKRIWLLLFAQAWIQFSTAVLWVLWAPTLVADGREVHLGMIYPCLLGARMLGSTIFPWLNGRPSVIQTEDYLIYTFIIMGLVFSVIAYDYQDVEFLAVLFCILHACVGLVLPSLAKLRSTYVPSELRGGMLGLSLALGNSATLFGLLQRGYCEKVGNAELLALAGVGVFASAGCMHLLRRSGKQQGYEDAHRL